LGSQLLRDLPTHLEDIGTIHVLDNMQKGEYQALMELPDAGTYVFWEVDVMDRASLRTILADVDVVIHLAAVVQTPLSFADPNWVEQVNHWGTSNLVEVCLDEGVGTFVFASSASVYGPGSELHTEEAVCDPVGAYADSKYKAERVVASASRRGMNTVTLRMGTLFGPAPVLRFTAVANRFASLAGTRRTLTVYGDGEQTRPLLHVEDASDAICWAWNHVDETSGETYNVHHKNASILNLVDAVRMHVSDVEVRRTEQDIRTHLSFAIAGEKIRRAGWAPSFSLEDGLGALIRRFGRFAPSSVTRRQTGRT
jgi:nucleoside-diphosphate-sugar epimerase